MARTATDPRDGVRPSRVVILLDASPDALRALRKAAGLAREYRVPLLAVSVEEPDRVRSAGFPFAREVSATSGAIRPIEGRSRGAGRSRGPAGIRRSVERAARAAGLAWEMVVLRGDLVEEVLAVSRPDDCLLLGRVGWSARLGRKLGGAPLMLARRAGGLVHICPSAPQPDHGRVAVLIEDVAGAREVLAAAAARAVMTERELIVLLAPAIDEPAIEQLAARMSGAIAEWRLRRLAVMNTGEMLGALAEERAAELVIGRGGSWLASPGAARLLARWPMPVVVAPGGRDETG